MYCKDCGKEIEEGKEYCAECEAVRNTETATGTENVVNENTTTSTQATSQKSKMAAGLFGIFLGAFGVLSCFTLSVVSEIWGLIEGILILTGSMNTDADGNPLKD